MTRCLPVSSLFPYPTLFRSSVGVNVQHLVDAIVAKVSDDLDLVEKLHSTVCKTLGASLEDSIAIKYDPVMARDSLRFYRRSEEHTSELQSPYDLVCRLLLEK